MDTHSVLHHESFGDPGNPCVVFLHGFMGNVRDWDDSVDCLKARVRCLVVDLPGHGKSQSCADEAFTVPGAVRLVARTLAAARAVPAVVVGYSMGGRLALYLATHYSHLCSALVMESATAGLRDVTDRARRQQQDEARAQALEAGRFEDFLRTWYSQSVFRSLADRPDRQAAMIQMRKANDPRALARAMRGLGVANQPSLWGHLPALPLPALFMAGGLDGKYVGIAREMAAVCPRATVEVVPEAGHNVHVENPPGFVESLKKFLNRVCRKSPF